MCLLALSAHTREEMATATWTALHSKKEGGGEKKNGACHHRHHHRHQPPPPLATPPSSGMEEKKKGMCAASHLKAHASQPLLLLPLPKNILAPQVHSPLHMAHALDDVALRAGWHSLGANAWAQQAVHSRSVHDHTYGKAPLSTTGPGAESYYALHCLASAMWQEAALCIGPDSDAPKRARDGPHPEAPASPPPSDQSGDAQQQHQPVASQHFGHVEPPSLPAALVHAWPDLAPDQQRAALRNSAVLGGPQWRPGQMEAASTIVSAIAEGDDALVVMGCGAGKSLALHRACAVAGACCLLLVPTSACRHQWLSSGAGESQHPLRLSLTEWVRHVDAMGGSRRLIVVATPEEVATVARSVALRAVAAFVHVVAFDEAHLWSQWASFRRSISAAMDAVAGLGRTRVALTGTLPPGQQQGVLTQLGMGRGRQRVRVCRLACARTDVCMRVEQLGRGQQLCAWVRAACAAVGIGASSSSSSTNSSMARPRAIVFVATKREVQQLVDGLADSGVPARPYHGDLLEQHKQQLLSEWARESGAFGVVVSTVALAVAVHVPNVQLVIDVEAEHAEQPLLDWCQKMGRLSRDNGSGPKMVSQGGSVGDRRRM